MVPDSIWLADILGEAAKAGEAIANLQWSSGQVPQSQTSYYTAELRRAVDSLASYGSQWKEQMDNEEGEAMRAVEVPIHEQTASAVRGDPDTMSIDNGHNMLPFDLPMRMKVHRVMGDIKQPDGKFIEGLLGWELELDLFTFDTTVLFSITRDPYKCEVMAYSEDDGTYQMACMERPGVHRPPTSDGDEVNLAAMTRQGMKQPPPRVLFNSIETSAIEIGGMDEVLDDDEDEMLDEALDDMDEVME